MRGGYILKGTVDDNDNRVKNKWVATSNYITIEIATKPRPQCNVSTFLHKRIHVCLCCYESNWNELEFIRRRVSKQDDTDPDQLVMVHISQKEHKGGRLKCTYCVK